MKIRLAVSLHLCIKNKKSTRVRPGYSFGYVHFESSLAYVPTPRALLLPPDCVNPSR